MTYHIDPHAPLSPIEPKPTQPCPECHTIMRGPFSGMGLLVTYWCPNPKCGLNLQMDWRPE